VVARAKQKLLDAKSPLKSAAASNVPIAKPAEDQFDGYLAEDDKFDGYLTAESKPTPQPPRDSVIDTAKNAKKRSSKDSIEKPNTPPKGKEKHRMHPKTVQQYKKGGHAWLHTHTHIYTYLPTLTFQKACANGIIIESFG
jgi:hypothetical protein